MGLRRFGRRRQFLHDTLIKAFKDAGCGILLGSLKDCAVFNAALPYGSYEKPEFDMAEGYLVARNKATRIKAAVDRGIIRMGDY